MTTANDRRRSVATATPVLALVGATDLVVERVRSAREHHVVQDAVQQAPTRAMNSTIALAARAEGAYGELAERGGRLVHRLAAQPQAQELLIQGKATLRRGRAAVATVRRVATGADETSAPPEPAVGTIEAPVAQPPVRKRSTTAAAPAAAKATKAAKAAAPKAPRAAKPAAVRPAEVAPVESTAAESTAAESTAQVTRAIHEAAEKADS